MNAQYESMTVPASDVEMSDLVIGSGGHWCLVTLIEGAFGVDGVVRYEITTTNNRGTETTVTPLGWEPFSILRQIGREHES